MKKCLNGGFLFASVFNYFLLVIVFFALSEDMRVAFPMAALALVILYALALTPIVDWYYRIILNLREPNKIEGKRLKRVWNMVINKSENAGFFVKDNIKLYISEEEGLNAFATGTRTIAVHRELLSDYISDEEIAGVLAHELAHHIHGDTVSLLISLQGTVIFGGIRFVIKIVFWIAGKLIASIVAVMGFMAADGNLDEGVGWWKIINFIMDKIYGFIDFFLTGIAYLETMCFRFFDRQQEFAADEFGAVIGCGNGLISFFGKLPERERTKKLSVEYLLYGTHPPREERIARLQKMTCQEEANKTQLNIKDEEIRDEISREIKWREVSSMEDYLLHPESYSGEELYKTGIFYINHGKEREGIEWLERAADNNEPKAYTELGYCYMEGKGVEADKRLAIKYFKRAYAVNEPKGTYMLAECCAALAKGENDFATVAKLYGKAAKLGDKRAQAKLGKCFWDGIGVKKNEGAAFWWFSKAVEEGDYSIAGYLLAKCYLEGVGVEPNLKKGIFILKKVIEGRGADVNQAEKLLAKYSNMAIK